MAVCRLGVAALLVVSLWGCGYRPLGAAPPDPQVRPTLAIPLFANRSTEVGLETIFATALINAFAQTQAVKVVPGDREAELVQEGKVRSLAKTSVAFDSITRSSVRRVTLT
ncbi:MAG: LPS assembly lipoprotein LptE, partial [Syntrophales bacterium]|nr:LPS assembly lipoprotein LptE [Syntrophales bacterium]